MKKFNVQCILTLTSDIKEVSAKDEIEAREIAEGMYYSGELQCDNTSDFVTEVEKI